MAETNRYLELSRLDCSHGIEVKHGGLQYLKWSVAWHLLMTKHPDATYYYDDPITLADGTMLVPHRSDRRANNADYAVASSRSQKQTAQ